MGDRRWERQKGVNDGVTDGGRVRGVQVQVLDHVPHTTHLLE